jgi:hypothetical protein
MDHSRTAWTAILRGSCLVFFKAPIDELPAADNEASRQLFKEYFFGLPEHRLYDLFEFLLSDDRAGVKEMDRKLIRRKVNEVLDGENAQIRLLRDKFVPLPDSLGFDAVTTAEEKLNMFDIPAALRHLDSAVAFLSRRPEAAGKEAVREAVLSVAAVVRTLSGETGKVELGTVAPLAVSMNIPPDLLAGMEATLRRCHEVSGLPGATSQDVSIDLPEAAFLVVSCSSVVNYLLAEKKRQPG